jgi:ribosomal protein S18 acetylase RimI-like enzyme
MVIERATIEDVREILALQKLAYKSEAEIYDDYNIQPLTQTIEEITDEFKIRTFFKITHEGIIIGSVRANVQNDTCFIGKLIVHPEYQNRGVGSSLMGEVENNFGTVRRFALFTGHKSLRNLYLYKKLGYKEFRREKINSNLIHVFMEKQRAT